MADIPYVCLYMSYIQSLSPFTDEERGKLVMAMMLYAATGEIPQFEGNERFMWPSLQMQIDRDIENYKVRCAKNKENGAKGGRPPKNRTVITETERLLEEPKKPNKNEKKKEKKKEKDKENSVADKPPKRHVFSPPTVAEVREYCLSEGYIVDPDRFVDYYTSNGWIVGKTKMKDWKAAVRNWSGKDKKNGKAEHKPIWSVGTEI